MSDRDTEIGELGEREGATWDTIQERLEGARDRRIAEQDALRWERYDRIAELEADLAEARHWIEEYRDLAGKFEADLVTWRDLGDEYLARAQKAEADLVAARQERDEHAYWRDEYFDQKALVKARVARLEQALEQARDCCARPPGVCFDPALAGGDTEPTGERP